MLHSFILKDSEGNKAKGEFVFDKSRKLYVKVKTYKRADGSKTYPKTESIMTREEPMESTPAAEQESSLRMRAAMMYMGAPTVRKKHNMRNNK